MRIDRDVMKSRLRDYLSNNYTQFNFAIKSGVLAIAGLAAIAIVSDGGDDMWPRVVFWFAAIGIITISLTTWNVGSLFGASTRFKFGDVLWPSLMGVTEYAMFGILVPIRENPDLWPYFPALAALHALIAHLLVSNRLEIALDRKDFHKELKGIEDLAIDMMKFDKRAALRFVLISLFLWCVVLVTEQADVAWAQFVYFGVGGVLFLMSVFVSSTTLKRLSKAEDILLADHDDDDLSAV